MTLEISQVYLASSSPQRYRLLRAMNLQFDVIEPDIDETPYRHETVSDYVVRVATQKSQKASEALPAEINSHVVVGADTCVAIDNRKLGKPVDAADARRMLELLSGQVHEVHSAVAVANCRNTRTATSVSQVEFHTLTDAQISAFIASGEAENRAGAYAIQGRAGAFVKRLAGSFSAVIGMPIRETAELLQAAGVSMPPYVTLARKVEHEFPIAQDWFGNYCI